MGKVYFKINDKIVVDCLDSLSSVRGEKLVIVGGLAIQLHGREWSKYFRKTPDVDLLMVQNCDFDSFLREIYPDVSDNLKREGYKTQPKRGRGNNAVKVMKNPNHEDSETFLMHWTKFSQNIYPVFFDYISRQIYRSEEMPSPSGREKIRVAALEEIVPLKVQRIMRFGSDRESLVGPIYSSLVENAKKGNWGALAGIPLGDLGKGVERLQNQLGDNSPYTEERFRTYKLSKDLYDLCFVSRIISDSVSPFDSDRYGENIHRILERDTQ